MRLKVNTSSQIAPRRRSRADSRLTKYLCGAAKNSEPSSFPLNIKWLLFPEEEEADLTAAEEVEGAVDSLEEVDEAVDEVGQIRWSSTIARRSLTRSRRFRR